MALTSTALGMYWLGFVYWHAPTLAIVGIPLIWVLLLFVAAYFAKADLRSEPPCGCESVHCRGCGYAEPEKCDCSCGGGCARCYDHHRHNLAPIFKGAWLAWAVLVIWSEFLAQGLSAILRCDLPPAGKDVPHVWLGLILWFAGLEITALLRQRIGDTFSEQAWAFMHKEISRAGIAVGLVALLIVRIVEVGKKPITILGEADLGRILLGLGVGAWVVYHFVDREIKRRRRFR